MVESILRLSLVSGVSEEVAKLFSPCLFAFLGTCVDSSCHGYLHIWELVGSFIKIGSPQIRRSALESMELWGLTKGVFDCCLLTKSQPIFHVQFTTLFPSPSVSFLWSKILVWERIAELIPDSEQTLCLRDELSALIESPNFNS